MNAFSARLLVISTPEEAERELIRIGADSHGVRSMAPKMRTRCIHLSGLQCRQANILKQEMLSIGGDAAVARGAVACSIESTDVILIGTEKQLAALCPRLELQPFGLRNLAQELKTLLERMRSAPAVWRTAQKDLTLERPLIMGVLNTTPDSFFDGSNYLEPERAIERALEMAAEGADIIDIGGESTRPGAEPVSPEEEIKRVIPVISELAKKTNIPLSVDTWKAGVAQRAMDVGAEIINDISGLTFDPSMARVASETKAGIILTHTRGAPQVMQSDIEYADITGEIVQYLRASVETAQNASVERERIVVDPGIGFAKDCRGNLEIIRRLREFSSLGFSVLVGASRKSFIGLITGRYVHDRLFGTAAVVALAVANGASILRVHDVRAMRDATNIAHAIVNGTNIAL